MPELQEAIKVIKSGDKETGKRLLTEILKADQRNETAWLWMTQAVSSNDDRLKCLQNVLKINPHNEAAKKGLAALQPLSKSPEVEPQPIKPSPQVEVAEPSSKSEPIEELDLKKVHSFVVDLLDKFGMQKWGEGRQGCLFVKGKKYGVYQDTGGGNVGLYVWSVASNKCDYAGEKSYKQAGYQVSLYQSDEESYFVVRYSGYSKYFFDGKEIHGFGLWEDIRPKEVSASALKQALKEILTKGYEPMAIAQNELKADSVRRVV